MERLTFLNGDEVPCVSDDKCFEEQSGHYCGPAIDRLAAYEDIGLTPEQIEYMYMENQELASYLCTNGEGRAIELAKADKEGRVVVLPCKIGDTVWILQQRVDGSYCVRKAEFWWSDIPQVGKTVFLTRGEAEKALEEEKDD